MVCFLGPSILNNSTLELGEYERRKLGKKTRKESENEKKEKKNSTLQVSWFGTSGWESILLRGDFLCRCEPVRVEAGAVCHLLYYRVNTHWAVIPEYWRWLPWARVQVYCIEKASATQKEPRGKTGQPLLTDRECGCGLWGRDISPLCKGSAPGHTWVSSTSRDTVALSLEQGDPCQCINQPCFPVYFICILYHCSVLDFNF